MYYQLITWVVDGSGSKVEFSKRYHNSENTREEAHNKFKALPPLENQYHRRCCQIVESNPFG